MSKRYSRRHSLFPPLQRTSRSHLHSWRERSPTPSRCPKASQEPSLRWQAEVPINCRRRLSRPVSCYALFKGWLLLSQPPGCLSETTSFPLGLHLGTLAGGLGCSPHVNEAYPPLTHSQELTGGICGLIGFGKWLAPLPIQSPTSVSLSLRLYLNTLRGEPAISGFGRYITTTPSSSQRFALHTGSGLQSAFADLHPDQE